MARQQAQTITKGPTPPTAPTGGAPIDSFRRRLALPFGIFTGGGGLFGQARGARRSLLGGDK